MLLNDYLTRTRKKNALSKLKSFCNKKCKEYLYMINVVYVSQSQTLLIYCIVNAPIVKCPYLIDIHVQVTGYGMISCLKDLYLNR